MKDPKYIRAKWEKERKEKLQHAQAMVNEYEKSGNKDAVAWWKEKTAMLEKQTF